jgi:RNA polymerase sigma-70 factor (ECF subfamily)
MTWPPALPFAAALARAREHESRALSLLYHRFLPVVYRYVLGRVGDTHAAEDVTSETFLAMLRGIASTRASDELSFAAWVLGIARNHVAMYFRQRGHLYEPLDGYEEVEPARRLDEGDPLTLLTAHESWREIAAALERLTDEQRTVVLYRCVLDYSAEEVGQLLGKQAGAIRAMQFRALASLARILDGPRERDASMRRGSSQQLMNGSDGDDTRR